MEIWNSNPASLPVVCFLETEKSYYVFRKMEEAGYIYDKNDKAFYPPEIYALLEEERPFHHPQASMADYAIDAPDLDLGYSPANFANSFSSLHPILKPVEPEGEILGKECEVMFVTFPDTLLKSDDFNPFFASIAEESTVEIEFGDTKKIRCHYGSGSLLIPMGMQGTWYLSEIPDFTLRILSPAGETLYETSYRQQITRPASGRVIRFYSIKNS